MNFLNHSLTLSKNKQNFKYKIKKWLIIVGMSMSLFIGALISVLFNLSSNNLNNNHNLSSVSKQETVNNIKQNDERLIKPVLRVNPISNFESIDVKTTDGIQQGLKLMLSSCNKPEIGEVSYGVSLVNKENQIISSWYIPNNIPNMDTSLNYTTYIVQGNVPDTFFVLAGISNLAKALNTVYDSYNPEATIFNEVVKANLENAPSIKIFKIHVNNNKILSDTTNSVYDFKYPSFDERTSWTNTTAWNAGLKFFTRDGIFSSYANQQIDYAGNKTTYGAGGYYQYLYYGQMFEYNYDNHNEDEFALISTYTNNDLNLGNLYSYYDTTLQKPVSGLNNLSLHNYILNKVVDDSNSNNKPYKYKVNIKPDDKIPYSIKKQDGTIETAPINDQLTAKTAISIVFMMDFKLSTFVATDWTPTQTQIFNQVFEKAVYTSQSTSLMFILPGWFIFRPNRPFNDWVSYGYYAYNGSYPIGNTMWWTVISSTYCSNENCYDVVFFGPAWWTWDTNYVTRCKINYFSADVAEYGCYGARAKRDSYSWQFGAPDMQDNKKSITSPIVAKIFENPNFAITTTGADDDELLLLTKNNDQTTSSVINLPKIINHKKNNEDLTFGRFIFDEKTHILSYINNFGIYTLPIAMEDGHLKSIQKDDIKAEGFSKYINKIDYVNSQPILDPTINYSFDGVNNIQGDTYYIKTSDENKPMVYLGQSLTNKETNSVSLLDVINPESFGYSILKEDSEFQASETNTSINDLMNKYTFSELKNIFINDSRTSGSITSIKMIGIAITGATSNQVSATEIIEYRGQKMFGFAYKKDDLEHLHPQATYENVFKELISSIVWYINPESIPLDPKLKDVSVHDLITEYKNNFQQFQKDYFDLIISRIDEKDASLNYQLRISSFDEMNNEIVFNTVVITKNGEITLHVGNKERQGELNFTFKDAFKPYVIPNNTTTWVIVGSVVGVVTMIILGLSIGIPMHKHKKSLDKRMATQDKKMDTLITAIGKVFHKIEENIKLQNQRNSRLLEQKPRQPISSPTKSLGVNNPIKKSLPAPTMTQPTKPTQPIKIKSSQLKTPSTLLKKLKK